MGDCCQGPNAAAACCKSTAAVTAAPARTDDCACGHRGQADIGAAAHWPWRQRRAGGLRSGSRL